MNDTENDILLEPLPSTFESNLVASLILFLSLIAVLLNIYVLFCIKRLKVFQNAFGNLCASRSVAQILATLVVLCWSTRWTYVQHAPPEALNKWAGQLIYLSDFATVLINLVISVNRFCAIWFITSYQVLFGKTTVRIAILAVWIVALGESMFWFLINRQLMYDPFSYNWNHVAGEDYFNELSLDISVTVLTVLLDLLTLIKVVQLKNTISSPTCCVKRELRFFFQMAFQNLFNLTNLASLIWIPTTDSLFADFILKFALWIITFVVDGFLFVAFNPETRRIRFGSVLFAGKKPRALGAFLKNSST